MVIKRDQYLNQLISHAWDGQVKVITGIRRCGKSFLLHEIYKPHLLENGVKEDQIITIQLDLASDIVFRNPLYFSSYVKEIAEGKNERFYLFVDEIQMSDEVLNPHHPSGKKITFYDALNDLRTIKNLDVYVTGSNSRMLSKDIMTEFRGRSDEIQMHPLSFSEYYSAIGGDKNEAFDRYSFYGGLPLILSRPNDESRGEYLKALFSEVYLKDIVERKKIARADILSDVVDFLCSSVGSLTNPTNISNSINSMQKRNQAESVSRNTVCSYMEHLEDAFLFRECKRFDVKGKSYFDYPNKYYCEDIGLRNARLGFRQQEPTHIMENILYNELKIRRCSVDIGIVYSNEKDSQGKQRNVAKEIDFIATKGGKSVYIQSAYAMETEKKVDAETKPFILTRDSFPKIIVRRDIGKRWYDDHGVLHIGVIDFLLDDTLI